jgi:hypothetical protein
MLSDAGLLNSPSISLSKIMPVLAVPVTGENLDWSLTFIDYALEPGEE